MRFDPLCKTCGKHPMARKGHRCECPRVMSKPMHREGSAKSKGLPRAAADYLAKTCR